MGSESLKNTPFEKEITAVFDLKKKGENKINVSAGVYNLALFWYDAVKLRLRTDWMEPAHPVYQLQSELMGMRQSPQSAQAMNQSISPNPGWSLSIIQAADPGWSLFIPLAGSHPGQSRSITCPGWNLCTRTHPGWSRSIIQAAGRGLSLPTPSSRRQQISKRPWKRVSEDV